jgi:hypothetical protein
MRKNSQKQTEASRINGAKGKGPKSSMGKDRVRLNALKDGLFSKNIVIKSLGERKEDFERLKKETWDFFQPASAFGEMLVADIVENRWRRQRVRRAESADMKNRLDTLWIRDELRRSDEVASQKVLFFDLLGKYVIAVLSQPTEDTSLTVKLEEVRQKLAGTSLGVEFLIKRLEGLDSEVQAEGQLSGDSLFEMLACCGFGNEEGQICLQLDLVNFLEFKKAPGPPAKKHGKQKRAKEKKTGQKEAGKERPEFDKGMYKQVLSVAIREATRQLKVRKKLLEYAEKFEAKTRTTASVFPAEGSDRFLRAETTIERRMYRALVMLLALRSESGVPKMLT